MKNSSRIIFLIFFVTFLILVSSVSAQNNSFIERVQKRSDEASVAAQNKRVQAKARLEKIRDTKKKATVERIQAQLESINKKKTEQMAKFLTRLSVILDKIESRKDKAKAKGRDVSAVETAIAKAKKAIETAKAAVEAQAAKSYVIEVSDEAGLKNVVGKAISSLQKDLRNTHKIVVDAKQTVQKISALLGQIKGVDDEK